MPAQRRSNAIYTHYKALSCDYGGMLIKQFCEDRAGRAALTERAKRVDKTLHNYKGGRRVCVCVFEWCGCRTRAVEGSNMCEGMSVWF